jgi:HAD superfamily hydrolase (TIGR01509 family)
MNPIKAVIFDLGRVLVQVDFSRGLLRRFAQENNFSDQHILDQAFRDPLFKEFSKGVIDAEQFYHRLLDRFQLPLSFDEFSHLWCDIFSPMEGMEELVTQVAARYPIGLLSDIDPLHWRFLKENFSILQYFKNPVLSYEIGALKPSRECYRRAATAVGEPHRFCLFIDDRPINIIGAKQSGMQTIHFKNPADLYTRLKELQIIG